MDLWSKLLLAVLAKRTQLLVELLQLELISLLARLGILVVSEYFLVVLGIRVHLLLVPYRCDNLVMGLPFHLNAITSSIASLRILFCPYV